MRLRVCVFVRVRVYVFVCMRLCAHAKALSVGVWGLESPTSIKIKPLT